MPLRPSVLRKTAKHLVTLHYQAIQKSNGGRSDARLAEKSREMSLRVKWQRMYMAVLIRQRLKRNPALFQDGRELVNLVALLG